MPDALGHRFRDLIDREFVLEDTPLRRLLARVPPALVPAGTVLSGPEAGAPGAPAFRPLPPVTVTLTFTLGAWVRVSFGTITVSGVYWFMPLTTFSAFPALSETAFVTARSVLGRTLLIGGQFAVPARQIVGFHIELDGGPLASGADTIVFQPRVSRQGGAWLDEGDYGELLGGERVKDTPASTLLAPGDAWTLQAYTTGDPVTIAGLKLTVLFAA